MLRTVSDVGTVARAIQLSVAPVFLLTGIGAMLSVMTNRLGRIIDRARLLEARFETATQEGHRELIRADLTTLARRAKLVGQAINLCTTTAFLVCSVIALMFIGAFLELDPSMPVAILFICAMLSMVLGLVCFLREIYIATANLRIGPGSQTPPTQ
ncbi:DUF2721 domain-containing protein [Trichlorobacter lovleyi]|uniref:DUF2721 domain-containing protein n=1 Tax=Trichlorobacter lovleyi (strain ATCC BAA-1151 / DSM 17278 / SZ) TaxID=398767 RepID=B3E2L2_TRIL1|nr:DUF2721 domain-containing protein [Trichlorobacter lovleyi]ACD95669.1 conserved hypothetical protein [Trichlorobacter lovleyi SZ]